MDDEFIKSIAYQLRKPEGNHAIEIGKRMNEGNRLINLSTIDFLRLQNKDNVLEIGMGNGLYVKEIIAKDKSIKYVGCDFSEAMVKESNKINDGYVKSGQAQFYLADADSLPFSNNSFDKVFTINTIYFWNSVRKVLLELNRVLKPSGKLTIALRPKSDMIDYPVTKYVNNLFSKSDIEKILIANNFRVTNSFVKKEPNQELLGKNLKVKSLIITAEKAR